jgi:hypothetical protein
VANVLRIAHTERARAAHSYKTSLPPAARCHADASWVVPQRVVTYPALCPTQPVSVVCSARSSCFTHSSVLRMLLLHPVDISARCGLRNRHAARWCRRTCRSRLVTDRQASSSTATACLRPRAACILSSISASRQLGRTGKHKFPAVRGSSTHLRFSSPSSSGHSPGQHSSDNTPESYQLQPTDIQVPLADHACMLPSLHSHAAACRLRSTPGSMRTCPRLVAPMWWSSYQHGTSCPPSSRSIQSTGTRPSSS